MKQPSQATIAEARRWADEYVARRRKSLTKKESADAQATAIIELTALMVDTRPDLVVKVVDAGKLRPGPGIDGVWCAFAARMLERGELPPKPLRAHAAEVLRQVVEKAQRGTLTHRNGEIAWMLFDLERRGIPLFCNRAGRRPGQTYGCDIVVEALKKSRIHVSVHVVESVWKTWSRVFART